MGEESKSACMLPYALPKTPLFLEMLVWLETESPVASFPPTNNPLDQY